MHLSIARAREAIATLCRRHHIARLEMFGSAARCDDFRPRSDADLPVAFEPELRAGFRHPRVDGWHRELKDEK